MEFGGVYKAKVVEIVAGGLMVQLYPTMKPTLLPNNQLDGRKVNKIAAFDKITKIFENNIFKLKKRFLMVVFRITKLDKRFKSNILVEIQLMEK